MAAGISFSMQDRLLPPRFPFPYEHFICLVPAIAPPLSGLEHSDIIRRHHQATSAEHAAYPLSVGQAPLQPLQDNLELQTYETFEKDDQKYLQYEEAVLEALLDRIPEAEAATRENVLVVCPGYQIQIAELLFRTSITSSAILHAAESPIP